MDPTRILWHDNSRRFPKDSHAMFGASNYHWLNYSDQKMVEMYVNSKAKEKGTELHAIAAGLIKNKIVQSDSQLTFNMYVNDSIFYDLRPEEQLYYSEWFYGTADAIGITRKVLRINDLKTGKTKPSLKQLEIYTALWCLEYDVHPSELEDIILTIYYDNSRIEEHADSELIVPIMDKMVTMTKIFEKLGE